MKPLVYLHEDEINSLRITYSHTNSERMGMAFAMDDYSVFHAHFRQLNLISSRLVITCKFIFSLSEADLNKKRELFFKTNNGDSYTLAIFLPLSNDKLQIKSWLNKSNKYIECEVHFIPEKSELYSRSKGLLEVNLLAKKKVGIVGVGSGGSQIALDLAKAGIGNFILIDYDRLELSNISRHINGINDLGRFKTLSVRDSILQKNPYASISTAELDVTKSREQCENLLSKVDLLICASDNDRSRFLLNEISLKYKIPAIFGRAITRAIGGDVLRVRPYIGPCYNCLYSQNVRSEGGDDEEISQENQAKKLLPDYTSESELKTIIQVGLASDIAPISNFMVKLSLVELSRGVNSGIKSLEEDLISDFYIWANRRENVYESWNKLEYNFNKPSILRWYGAKVFRDPNCMVCGI